MWKTSVIKYPADCSVLEDGSQSIVDDERQVNGSLMFVKRFASGTELGVA